MDIDHDLDIDIKDGVYSPSDDTFLLLEIMDLDGDENVLEIGCGSGFISLHCALKGCKVMSVDLSRKAIENTLYNANRNGLDIDTAVMDMFSGLSGRWDVIIFNPPYLPNENGLEFDHRWDGGERGDEALTRFLSEAQKYLKEEGYVYTVFSDRAPLENIEALIDKRYILLRTRSKTFSFETIYAVKLKKGNEN